MGLEPLLGFKFSDFGTILVLERCEKNLPIIERNMIRGFLNWLVAVIIIGLIIGLIVTVIYFGTC